ncbi:MAG: glycogen-binding domain-containing protein [Lentisphaeria bacterium]|nr:glycogen-binding domain-containing protein [Lentisphaeria bacterium]
MIQIEKSPESALRKVTFILTALPGHQVFVAGSFSDWEPDKHLMSYSEEHGVYSCEVMLAPGAYEYKLVIDGEWVTDIDNDNFSANDFGTLNSVINIG